MGSEMCIRDRGSYIAKAEIEKQFVSLEKYSIIANEYKDFREEVAKSYVSEKVHSYVIDGLESCKFAFKELGAKYDMLITSHEKATSKICTDNSKNIDSLLKLQEGVEGGIGQLVSKYGAHYKKNEDEVAGDLLKAEQQRIYSQQLNLQLLNLYEERAQCIK